MSDRQLVPEPGQEAAPDSSAQGIDGGVSREDETVEHLEQSRVGPGAGENEVVKVRSPVQQEGDEVTSHPTLRDDERSQRR